MIRHYLTFAHQAALLDTLLAGRYLAECWSQERNAIAMRFIDGDSLFVEISLDAHGGYALPRDDLRRARQNTLDFFQDMIGKRLVGVSIDDGERVMRFSFNNGRELACFFFGPGGGNVLLLDEASILESYRKYTGEYNDLLLPHAEKEIDPALLRERLVASSDTPARALAAEVAGLGRRLAVEAATMVGVGSIRRAQDMDAPQLDALLLEVDRLYARAQLATEFHIYYLPDEIVLSLVALTSLDAIASGHEVFSDIGRAVRAWRVASGRHHEFTTMCDMMRRRLLARQSRIERGLVGRHDAAALKVRADTYELYAGLLMSNATDVEQGVTSVALDGWDGERYTIDLVSTLSAIENAERYYRKARGTREQIGRAQRGIELATQELAETQQKIERLERATTVAELRAIHNEAPGIFRMAGEARTPGTAERFRRFDLPGGHEVYAGKNAASNDELTLRFARANDYWFHARGSSGSHVVLRWGDPKSKPPREALRAAASIAAYYSGARNAKMVSVAYTLKKYVRKPKGSHPGSVVMEREEVMLVEPALPGGS